MQGINISKNRFLASLALDHEFYSGQSENTLHAFTLYARYQGE